MAENKGEEKCGRVVEVIGPVVDILFQEHHLPHIHYAVRITSGHAASPFVRKRMRAASEMT